MPNTKKKRESPLCTQKYINFADNEKLEFYINAMDIPGEQSN
jgi:hypothetical protein